ncbi:hypothetical protein G6F22_019490 [Rhizopus arrhizus]|nr:hypothetical protein G6F22_019490 [Rhizopus arrhizus]
MAFQFGTNWPRLSEVAGTVIGPLLTYEVLTAFFLEASFLGVMMFGWGRLAAHAGRLRDGQWHRAPGGLVAGGVQPLVPVPPGAHGAGFVHHHLFRDRWRRRVVPAQGHARGSRPAHAGRGGSVRGADGASADLRRRHAWPEHAQASADEDRGDGSALA